jgi:hypothetical protein
MLFSVSLRNSESLGGLSALVVATLTSTLMEDFIEEKLVIIQN